MTLGQVISGIQSEYSKGVPSQSVRVTDRFIYNTMAPIRAKVISQAATKRQILSDWVYQTLACIEMTPVDLSDCPTCVPTGCKAYRSLQKFPSVITSKNDHLVKSLTSVDGRTTYDYTTWDKFRLKSFSRFTASHKEFFFHNEYLYLIDTVIQSNLNKRVTMVAAFDDPVSVYLYPSCTQTCIDIFEKEFPLNGQFLDSVTEMTVVRLKELTIERQPDTTSNLREDG